MLSLCDIVLWWSHIVGVWWFPPVIIWLLKKVRTSQFIMSTCCHSRNSHRCVLDRVNYSFISLSVFCWRNENGNLDTVITSLSQHIYICPQKIHTSQSPQRTNIILATTIGGSVQVQPANTTCLIMERRTVFPVLICGGDDRQKCPCCLTIDNGPGLCQIAEEIDVLLWLFPPGVASERMGISAESSLSPATAFTFALCPHPG